MASEAFKFSGDYLERQCRADDGGAGKRNEADGFSCVGWRPHAVIEFPDHPGFEIWRKNLPPVQPPHHKARFLSDYADAWVA